MLEAVTGKLTGMENNTIASIIQHKQAILIR